MRFFRAEKTEEVREESLDDDAESQVRFSDIEETTPGKRAIAEALEVGAAEDEVKAEEPQDEPEKDEEAPDFEKEALVLNPPAEKASSTEAVTEEKIDENEDKLVDKEKAATSDPAEDTLLLEPTPTPTSTKGFEKPTPATPEEQTIEAAVPKIELSKSIPTTPTNQDITADGPSSEPSKAVSSNECPPACSNFVLDLNSSTFNSCRNCGQPRLAHVDYSRASEELKGKWVRSKSVSRASEMQNDFEQHQEETDTKKTTQQVCPNFDLDVGAKTFNTCKNCGFPKLAHVNYSRASEELQCKLVKRNSENSIKINQSETKECCNNFRRDLSGVSFDTCVCGFPKSDHINKENWNGANDELASKLQRRPSNGMALTETEEETPIIELILNAVKASDNTKLNEIFTGNQDAIDLTAIPTDEVPPLQLAATNGSTGICKLLLDKGAPLDTEDPKTGSTPLALAAQNGKLEVCTLLLSRGAAIASTDKLGATPLHKAASKGHTSVCQLLLKNAPENINLTDNQQYTALHRAAENGHTLVVKLLCDKGASTKLKTKLNTTPLDLAIKKKHSEAATIIRQADAAPGCKCLIS